MSLLFDSNFRRTYHRLREGLLPFLKGRLQLEESATGTELTPIPDSHRGYVPGDDTRAIDWNLYARLDRLYLKSMVHEEELPVIFLLDTSGSMGTPHADKFIFSRRIVATLAGLSLALGHRVMVVPWREGMTGFHGPYLGENDLESVLRVLESLEPVKRSSLGRTLSELIHLAGVGRAAPVIVSDFLYAADYGRELGMVAHRLQGPRCIQVLDRNEVDFRSRGNLVLTDPESADETRMHAGYAQSRAIAEAITRHLADTRSLVAASGGSLLRAFTDRPLPDVIRDYYAHAAVLAP